jgi:hypothetical protein
VPLDVPPLIAMPQPEETTTVPAPPTLQVVSSAELVGSLEDLRVRLLLLNRTLAEQGERDSRRIAAWDRMTQSMDSLRTQMARTQGAWEGLTLLRYQRIDGAEPVGEFVGQENTLAES